MLLCVGLAACAKHAPAGDPVLPPLHDDPRQPITSVGDAGTADPIDALIADNPDGTTGDMVISAPDLALLQPATIQVTSSSCNGARCQGAYNGKKQASQMAQSTINELCHLAGRTTGLDWTFSGDQPGGRFCSYDGTTWSCDNSCSGCNPMTSVICQ
jgi:hypothetical protein